MTERAPIRSCQNTMEQERYSCQSNWNEWIVRSNAGKVIFRRSINAVLDFPLPLELLWSALMDSCSLFRDTGSRWYCFRSKQTNWINATVDVTEEPSVASLQKRITELESENTNLKRLYTSCVCKGSNITNSRNKWTLPTGSAPRTRSCFERRKRNTQF